MSAALFRRSAVPKRGLDALTRHRAGQCGFHERGVVRLHSEEREGIGAAFPTVLEKKNCDVDVAVAERHRGGSRAIEAVLGVDIRTTCDEQPYRFEAAVARGEYQRGHVVSRSGIDTRALGERHLNPRDVAGARCLKERLIRADLRGRFKGLAHRNGRCSNSHGGRQDRYSFHH